MRLPFKPKKRKKKFKWLYKLRNYNGVITRAGITANPLEMYNPVALTTVPNNTLVKHGGLDFVGGDTDTIEYDFFTKVAGSTVECPMRITWYPTSTLCTPSNIADDVIQANIDKIKIQDGTSWTPTATLNGQIQQILVEVDLTPLANVVGGNNSLKSLLKSINVDVWAMGSGANSGVSTNGVQVAVWHNGGINSWSSVQNGLNVGASISKISYPQSVQTQAWYSDKINANNKIYILINAQYSSDGTIPSSVSLDYLKVTVQLNRVPDTVSPISVNLPKYFAMVGAFSPCFDSSRSGITNRIFRLYKDTTNYIDFYRVTTGQVKMNKFINSINSSVVSTIQTFSKNQMYKFIVGQSANGTFMYLLKNNGTMEKVTNTDINQLNGLVQLHILNQNNIEQGDSFLDNLILIDLEKMGKSAGFTDDEAESILRGDDRYYVTSNADFVGKITGSVVENPHKAYRMYGGTLITPPSFTTEDSQGGYDATNTLNGVCDSKTSLTSVGSIAQIGYSFNIIEHLEKKYGTLPCPQDLASKIAWAKANIKSFTCNWYGYGVANGVNRAYFDVWYASNNVWHPSKIVSNTSSSPTLLQMADSDIAIPNRIDSNGFVHFLAYTDSVSQAGNTATIYTDYVALDVNCKIAITNPNMPNPELFDINQVNLHASASRNGNTITINSSDNTSNTTSTITIPVLPNNRYNFKFTGSANSRVGVDQRNNSVTTVSTGYYTTNANADITTGAYTNNLYLRIQKIGTATGIFTLTDFSLKRKD